MSIFGSIMDKIFHHPAAAAATPSVATAQVAPAAAPPPTPPVPASSASPAPTPPVDVGAVLTAMAQMRGGGGNYQSSIVDLLKLLDLDSSLATRKTLAGELNVHVGVDGSAEENIALHAAVMEKLAENGGVVPASFRH